MSTMCRQTAFVRGRPGLVQIARCRGISRDYSWAFGKYGPVIVLCPYSVSQFVVRGSQLAISERPARVMYISDLTQTPSRLAVWQNVSFLEAFRFPCGS